MGAKFDNEKQEVGAILNGFHIRMGKIETLNELRVFLTEMGLSPAKQKEMILANIKRIKDGMIERAEKLDDLAEKF